MLNFCDFIQVFLIYHKSPPKGIPITASHTMLETTTYFQK